MSSVAREAAATCNFCAARVDETRDVAWRKDGFDVLRCPSCGLLFRRSVPDREELDELYGETYFGLGPEDDRGTGYADYLRDEELHRLNARARLQALERFRAPGRLLDVGAAAGFFLDEARRRGWEVRGVDVSEPMSDWARERLDLDVTTDVFEEGRLEGSFDAVTMWDYIEHSVDPTAALEQAAALLEPGGVLALSTGDASSLAARISGSRWHLLVPAHTFYFTRNTLTRYLDRAGFDVLEVGYPPSLYSVAHAAYKLRTLADVAPLRALAASRAGSISLPLNLWDILTVHARRR